MVEASPVVPQMMIASVLCAIWNPISSPSISIIHSLRFHEKVVTIATPDPVKIAMFKYLPLYISYTVPCRTSSTVLLPDQFCGQAHALPDHG